MMEVAPGIHRIESTLGPRPFSQYLLRGERSLLVDTGINTTPRDVILPFFEKSGLDPAQLDYVLISHADVDHFGGNAAMREAATRAVFLAHEADADWIGDRERILRERYGWYAAHGPEVDYDDDTKAFLRNGMGSDVSIDLRLQGGERIRLGPKLTVTVIPVPGHSMGHVGLWDPASRTAIVMDGVLGGGLLNFEGQIIHPPPYFDAGVYEATIARLQALRPERLLTAHYDVMEGQDAEAFLALSADFVQRARAGVEATLREDREVTLASMLAALAPELGPFSSFPNELAGSLRAHLRELVAAGRVTEDASAQPTRWRWIGG
jgi:glyoxylase-like metal-dependent hydrolase (beta-lactamase superfamily II)